MAGFDKVYFDQVAFDEAAPTYSATLIGEGIIVTTASGIFTGSSSLIGEGSLSAASLKKLFAQADIKGEGQLAADALRTAFGEASVIGEGSLSADALKLLFGQGSVFGEGLLTSQGYGIFGGSALVIGEGILSALVREPTILIGEGLLSVSAYIRGVVTPALLYVIELRDSSGNLVAVLQNAHDISYVQMINSPHTLSFALPANDNKASNILLSNEMWLRNHKTGEVVKKFRLSTKRDIRT